MRYQGRLTEWNDARGFGFIVPNGGGAKVFVHIRAFEEGLPRPAGNELLSYEVVNDSSKGPRAHNVAYVGTSRRPSPARRNRRGGLSTIVGVLILAGVGIYYWQQHTLRRAESLPQARPAFSCQGKHYCTEMISCEEATFYLKNCPDVKIDGDGDGIPCEGQLCGH